MCTLPTLREEVAVTRAPHRPEPGPAEPNETYSLFYCLAWGFMNFFLRGCTLPRDAA